MRFSKIGYLVLVIYVGVCTACTSLVNAELESPDGRLKVTVSLDGGKLIYSLYKGKHPLIDKGQLGLRLQDHPLDTVLRITGVQYREVDEWWDTVWGEEDSIRDHYREMRVSIQEDIGLKRKWHMVFRLFDEGLGFRYEFPKQKGLEDFVIVDEATTFALNEDAVAWSIPYDAEFYEALYRKAPISALDTVSTPLTMVTADSTYLAIHEANLTDYAAMNLFSEGTTLKVHLTPWSTGEKVFVTDVRVSPWRTVIVAENPAQLMASRLMLNLNEPVAIDDTSWIKTGKYVGIWWGMHMKHYTWEYGEKHGATTENTMRYLDFAAANGFQGVLVEGWNKGWEDWKSYDFTGPYPDFDTEKVVDYAATKGVSLIGHHETGGRAKYYEDRLDSAFAYYHRRGVHAVKTGYVGGRLDGQELHSSQYGVRHYRKVIETAAKYQIMIDNHEPVMPTGLQRTYPNLVTQEGVRGQEWNAWSDDGGNPPDHTLIIPFTRGLAGPIDYTPVIFHFENTAMPNTKTNTTLAKELALFVVLYSPWQMAADMIEHYMANPKPFEFVRSCPTNWSQTKVVHAAIGEYLTLARQERNGEDWFLGSITNEEGRTLPLSLDFLDPDVKYRAYIYRDGENAHYQRNPYPVEIDMVTVDRSTTLTLVLAAGGGQAIHFEKIK